MHEFMTRGGPVSLDHMRKLHDAADDLSAAPPEPADALATSAASSHHAGAGEGRQRAPDPVRDAMRAGLRAHVVIADATADALMLAARVYVHSLWDHAVALAAEEGPVPLASDQPWEEPDTDLRNRLRGILRRMLWTWDELDGDDLSNVAEEVGLPRARLVRGPDRIADLDRVEVLAAVESDRGTTVPAGTQGTVVGVWAGGQAYEVEFWNGVDAYGYSSATVAAESLRLVPVEA